MNILCVSKDLSMGDLACRLKAEGHHIRLFVDDKEQKHNLDGMLEKTTNWKKELKWVGKSGLIVFDSVGYGKEQDDLREAGYSVVGGSYLGDKLEHDRQNGQRILSLCGLDIVPSINFCTAKEAIDFVKKNKGPWVIKQNGHIDKAFNYVGQLENNGDVIEVLKSYFKNNRKECYSIDLQKKIEGIEIGVGRYFNGFDWVGPIEINVEHKNLFNGELGPKTYEMGTLMWYEKNEHNKLFKEVLAKVKPFLQKSKFRGDVDVNCIVAKDRAYPLEITARFGFPALQLQSEIHISPWGEFLKAIADGEQYDLKYKEGYGIVALVATPPFPYRISSKKYCTQGINILFKEKVSKKRMQNIHFEEVSLRKNKKEEQYYISSKTGYILHVSGIGKTVKESRDKVYKLIDKIVIPKMFYRTDIGLKFIEEDQKKLREWGWI